MVVLKQLIRIASDHELNPWARIHTLSNCVSDMIQLRTRLQASSLCMQLKLSILTIVMRIIQSVLSQILYIFQSLISPCRLRNLRTRNTGPATLHEKLHCLHQLFTSNYVRSIVIMPVRWGWGPGGRPGGWGAGHVALSHALSLRHQRFKIGNGSQNGRTLTYEH